MINSAKTMRGLLVILIALPLLVLLPSLSFTQFYNGSQMSFGKNRVQYKEFQWTYYKYQNFDVYFYLGGQELALYTADFAQKNLDQIEDKLDTSLDEKIQFIVYNNLTDLKQSNIGLVQDQKYNTGGVTHVIGKKVFLYFDGSHHHFDQQIRAGIAQNIVNQLLYGSSIGSQIKNTSLFPFPDWYLNGLVSYISEEWNTEIDNRVRDGIVSGRYDKFNILTGRDATYAGHAFWHYIAQKYGTSSISNILYMAKVSRRLESGFLYILGVSFKNLVNEALDHYRAQYLADDQERDFPAEMMLTKNRKNLYYNNLKISPDGNYVGYVWNKNGRYKVFLHDLRSGKRKAVYKGGYRLDEKIDYSYPLIAWHPSGRILAIVVERKGETIMNYYLLDEKKTESVMLFQFQKVLDFSYADNGRDMVMSAVQRGQTDIFVYNIGSNSFQQITKDHYDDLYPRFINNSRDIIFSSNRISDTIRFETRYKPGEVQGNYDLFLYNYSEKSNILRRVTDNPLSNEIRAMEYSPGYISFLSDQNGIYNRYIGWFDSAINFIDTTTHYRYFTSSYPVTNYSRNIREHDIAPSIAKYSQVLLRDQKYYLQIYDQETVRDLTPVEPGTTPFMESRINLYGDPARSIDTAAVGEQRTTPGKRPGFSTVRQSDAMREYLDVQSGETDQKIDIKDYQFDRDELNWRFTDIGVPLDQLQADKDDPPKRLNYNVEYFINEIITQVDFSYLNQNYQPFSGGSSPIYLNPGFNALFQIGVTDLLEDYRITGGVRVNLNLINNEYLLSFANLKRRMDKEIILHRQVNEYSILNFAYYRVFTHEVFYILKWPFSPVLAAKSTFNYKYERGVFRSTDAFTLEFPKESANTTSFKQELIYDNTKDLGVNLFDGTRFKIFGEYYQSVDNLDQHLVVVGADFRNYQPIHRTLILANRFATSTSFGNNKLIYYMGGVDNWMFPKFLTTTPVDLTQNYAYQTLATNLRGFHQNIRNGNSFAVLNSEIRFPVFRYFSKSPIKSDFLYNFQLVGFGDVGTAWTGLHPYSDDNFLYTRKIEQPPLNITVKVQKEPIVGGFGFGARTRVLGYFIRGDLAWGVEDGKATPAIFYFSLSLDF
jgi:Tol biopolymer transport system component